MKKLRFLMPVGCLAIAAAFGAVVMLLWNWLMPAIAGFAAINFWQATGLLVLCRILFGGFGHHRCGGHGHNGMHGRMHHGRMHAKWAKMSDEQRQEFINRRMEHMDGGPFGWKRAFCCDKPDSKTTNVDDAAKTGE